MQLVVWTIIWLCGQTTYFCYESTLTCAAYWTALWYLDAYAMRDVKDTGQQMGYRSLMMMTMMTIIISSCTVL